MVQISAELLFRHDSLIFLLRDFPHLAHAFWFYQKELHNHQHMATGKQNNAT
jgi:hypothetical protein